MTLGSFKILKVTFYEFFKILSIHFESNELDFVWSLIFNIFVFI